MSTKIHKFTEEQLANKIIDIADILNRKALENTFIIKGIGIDVQTEEPIIYYKEVNSNITQITHIKNGVINMYKLTQDEKINYIYCKLQALHNYKLAPYFYHIKDKSKLYSVLGFGYDHVDNQLKVIYKAWYGHELTWIRDNVEWNTKFKECENDFMKEHEIKVNENSLPTFYPITLVQNDNSNNSYKYGFYLSFTINILLLLCITSKK